MAAIGQTITIVNKSGKIVSTSKHLVSVFNEAKSAYNERKAELKAFRKSQSEKKSEVRKARKDLEALNLDDEDSTSRRSSRRGSDDARTRTSKSRTNSTSSRRERPPVERRGVSDSFYTNDKSSREHRRSSNQPSPLRQEFNPEPRVGELARRHTDGMEMQHRSRRPSGPPRSASADDIDMDLAYGELPPPLPERRLDDEIELRAKMSGLQRVLDEANCLQHSVTAIIDNLQKNPDALAAVAVTLAEISNLAMKMAPGALASLKGSFPAIIALLASPEFAIAAGVGVGVTIIAFGGYKIIKKIQARKEGQQASQLGGSQLGSQLLELDADRVEPANPESEMESVRELDRIELWRRGIADAEAGSAGTSVDGEFITPGAAKTLMQDGRLTEADLKSRTDSDGKKKRRKHRSSKSDKESGTTKSKPEIRVKGKKESGIRMLFKGHSS